MKARLLSAALVLGACSHFQPGDKPARLDRLLTITEHNSCIAEGFGVPAIDLPQFFTAPTPLIKALGGPGANGAGLSLWFAGQPTSKAIVLISPGTPAHHRDSGISHELLHGYAKIYDFADEADYPSEEAWVQAHQNDWRTCSIAQAAENRPR